MAGINYKIGTISSKFHYPYEGMFGSATPPEYIIKEVTGNGYINLTNAVANHLMELKAYGGTEQATGTYLDTATAEGQCVQASDPTPSVPVDIVCNNGAVKYGILTKNLYNPNSLYLIHKPCMVGTQTNTFPNVSSTWANSITYFFVVKPNTTYTYSCSTVGDRLGIFGLNSIVNPNNYTTQSSLQFDTKFFSAGTSAPTELSYTFTTTADTKMVAIYCALNTPPTNIQIEVGSQATAYVNFQDGINVEGTTETVTDSRGFTATCQYLLGIDDDTDTQEIISGTVTRNIGYKIFDGTESFGSSSAYGTALYINAASAYWGANRNKAVLCTYFLGKSTAQSQQPLYTCFFNSSGHFYFRTTETATDFKTWLAEQYANGTPLILFFVKSTATTESVTGQTLTKEPLTATGALPDLVVNTTSSTRTIPAPIYPLDIKCNNGAIKYTPNLYNATANPIEQGTISSADGQDAETTSLKRVRTNGYISCKPNTTYNLSVVINGYTSGSSRGIFVFEYTDSEYVNNSGWQNTQSYSFTTGATTTRLRFAFAKSSTSGEDTIPSDISNLQLELGSKASVYQPYHYPQIYADDTVETIEDELGNTATAEMLLKVGDYVDEQEILSGNITRKIGIKVFNGKETFSSGNNGYISEDAITDQLNANYIPYCTHFAGTNDTPQANSNTVRVYYTSGAVARVYFGLDKTIYTSTTAFKKWLADQYNAGTPVIVVYPLATAATESVAGQTMNIQAGNNTIEITQASIDDLGLYAKYKATA